MKKFDLRKIMQDAWKLVKTSGLSMSEALKASWAKAKARAIKFINGMEFAFGGWCKILRRWTKNGMDRVYLNNENGKKCGYIDLINRTSHLDRGYDKMVGANDYCQAIMAMEF